VCTIVLVVVVVLVLVLEVVCASFNLAGSPWRNVCETAQRPETHPIEDEDDDEYENDWQIGKSSTPSSS